MKKGINILFLPSGEIIKVDTYPTIIRSAAMKNIKWSDEYNIHVASDNDRESLIKNMKFIKEYHNFNESIDKDIDWDDDWDDEEVSHDIIYNQQFTNFLIDNNIYNKYVKNIREQHNMYNNSIEDISIFIRKRSEYNSNNLITHAFKWSDTADGRSVWGRINLKWLRRVDADYTEDIRRFDESIDKDIDWEDIDDYEDDDDTLKVGDIIEVIPGIKELTVSKYPNRIEEDDPYDGYSASYVDTDTCIYKVKDVSQKKDGTPLIKIKYYYKTGGESISFWCWFYADEWQKKHI